MNLEKLSKLKKPLLIIFFSLTLIEFLSGIVIFSLPQFRIDTFVKSYFGKLPIAQIFGEMYNQELGWDYPPNSKIESTNVLNRTWVANYGHQGQRESLNKNLPVVATAYGDSFVHGDELDTKFTWAHYLEQILDGQVQNFGVGGYGTDQAYLKFKRHTSQGIVAPITILGIFEGDLSRISTNFRHFVTPESNIFPGFKSGFVFQDNKVIFLENPAKTTMDKKQIEKLILRLSKSDWGAKRQLYLQNQFPYTLQTLKAFTHLKDRFVEKFSGKDRLNSWHSKEEKSVMGYLVDEFIKTACKSQSTPVVLFFPDTNRWQKGAKDPQYSAFRDEIKQSYPGLVVVDIAQARFDPNRYTLIPLKGHLSPYGNMVVAQRLGLQLKTLPKGLNHSTYCK